MDKLIVYWTHTAIRQRNKTFEYWDKRNKSKVYSSKLKQIIRDRIRILKGNPLLGKKTNYPDTRSLFMFHYSIIYRLEANRIYILSFWDKRQDTKKLLRFLNKGE